jgi:HEAT repeat protein
MKARIIGALGIAGIAGIVGLVLASGDEPSAPAAAVARPGAPAWSLVAARELVVGVEHRYTVELDHASRQRGRDAFALGVDGEWVLAVLGTDEHGTTRIRAALEKPRVRLGTAWSPAPRFDVPYTFSLARDGMLIALELPREIDAETRAVLTALTATAQVTERATATWTAIETDSLGSFEAHYRRDRSTLHKTKRSYRSQRAVAIEVLRSATEIALRGDGWPAAIDQREEIRVGFDQASVTVAGHVKLKHAGVRFGVRPAVPANLEAVAIDATSAVDQTAADRELLDGASLIDLIATLGSVRDDGNASAHTYLRLVALFRLDAEAAREAGRAVLAGKLDKRDNAAVIGALGEAGTTESQHVLVGLVETQTLAHEHRVHGTLALGLTGDPTRETIAMLTTTSRASDPELSSTATLALGNAALRLRDQDAAGAEAQVDELLARLRATSDLETRIVLLRALGNTGDPRALLALATALSSPRELERAAAAESLRLMPGADASILLALDDRSAIVRAAAVFAASDRPLSALLARLVVRERSDEDVTVRRAILEVAASRITEHAELRALVEAIAAADPDLELRATALRYLQPG